MSQRGRSSGTSSGEASGAVTMLGKAAPEHRAVWSNMSALLTESPAVQGSLVSEGPCFGELLAQQSCPTHMSMLVYVGPAFPIPVTTDEETFPGILKIARWQK